MECSSHTTQKARKPHKCDWCRFQIEIGEKYQRQAIFDNGSAYTWKNHIQCMELTRNLKMFDETYGEGLGSEDFREHIYQYYIQNSEYKEQENELPKFKEMMDFAINFNIKY